MAVKASATVTLSSVVDVKSVWRYYKLQASTLSKPSKPTTNPPSGWTTTEPSYTDGSTNSLYFCDLTVFCDNSFSYSDVSLSSSYEAAKAAYNKATAANDKAQDAKDTVDNMEIGGRNLFTGTQTYKGWTVPYIASLVDGRLSGFKAVRYDRTKVTNSSWCELHSPLSYERFTNQSSEQVVNFSKIFYGKMMIVSFWARKIAGTPKLAPTLRIYNANGFNSYGSAMVNIDSDEWKFYSIEISLVNISAPSNLSNDGWYVYLVTTNTKSDNIFEITEPKLEIGNKPTDWSPAPEDMATADDVTQLVTRVTNAETSITNNTNEIKLKATKTEVTEAIDSIQVGARNLLVGTSTPVIHTGTGSTNQGSALYEMSDYYNSITKLQGRQLTLSFDWETTATSGKFIVQLDNTPWTSMSEWITPDSSNQSGKSVYTATCDANFDTGTYTGIKIRSDNLTGTVTIKNAMLELGNKASSWQPAPEDMLSISEAANTYTTQTEFTQTSDEIRMDFTQSIASASNDLQSQIADSNTSTNEKFGEINKYIRFVDGKIVLGESGNELMLTIQNDRVSFTQAGVEVAYFSNNNLYIKRAEVLTTLKVGNYQFSPRNDGGLALRKRSV